MQMCAKVAAVALGNLGHPQWRSIVLGDAGDWQRIAKSGEHRALALLSEALQCHDREPIAKVLGDLGDPLAAEPLIQALVDHDPTVRRAVAEALGKLGDLCAVEPLIKALGDEVQWVRPTVAESLGRFDDDRAIAALIGALSAYDDKNRPHEDLRQAAARALAKVNAAHVLGPLIKAIGDQSIGYRGEAVKVLGNLGDRRAVPAAIKVLEDERGDRNGHVRPHVAVALGKLADTRAVGPLIKTLGEDAYSEVRRAAAEALDALGESTWKTLVQGDDDDWSRLGASGDARAAAPLIMLLWDDDGHNALTAAQALNTLGRPEWKAVVKGDDDDFSRLAPTAGCTCGLPVDWPLGRLSGETCGCRPPGG